MIGVITFNPAIDKRYLVDRIAIGQVHRPFEVENTAGGKGINVLKVANLLGVETIATGFLGGKNGEFIIDELKKLNIESYFQKIAGETRCCLAIIDKANNQTEFLEPGPEIKEQEFNCWLNIYENILNKVDIITASGSLPRGLNVDTYKKIILKAKAKGVKFFLDTSGKALIKAIEAKPFFIKPNLEELRAVSKKEIRSKRDIIEAVSKLNEDGIELAVVTLGKDGSITGCKGKIYETVLPKVYAVNSVGSGDSFVAGMAAAFMRGMDIKNSIKFASACGCANAEEKSTGFVKLQRVESLFKDIIIKELD
jgi:tagatose 6-phosphate kinase